MKFEKNEIVLYRLMLAKIRDVLTVSGQSCYLLDSLESDHCQYQVPVENRMDHLQKLPDTQECKALLARIPCPADAAHHAQCHCPQLQEHPGT